MEETLHQFRTLRFVHQSATPLPPPDLILKYEGMYAPLYVMIGFRSPQAENLNNVKLGGDRGGHTWGKDTSNHWHNTGWCKDSSINSSAFQVLSVF